LHGVVFQFFFPSLRIHAQRFQPNQISAAMSSCIAITIATAAG